MSQIRITKHNYDIITDFMKTNSYTATANNFNISSGRVQQIHSKMEWLLKKNDPYMKVLFSNINSRFYTVYKKHPEAIKECFYRLVKVGF
jgi:hypothetical protein